MIPCSTYGEEEKMCRAGKDKTRRYCPATTDAEKVKERNARRRLAYHKSTLGKLIEKATADGILTPEEITQIGLKANRAGYKNHLEYAHSVIDKLRATGKETHLQHAKKTSNGDLMWDADRAKIHREIIQEQLAKWKDVPCNAEAVFSGGLGGAGKSTVLRKHANIDLSQYATLNPDDIKEVLAEKGLVPAIDGLTPMEASPLVHEEASYITSQLAKIIVSRKMNIIYDLTMAGYDSTKKKIDNLRNSGYEKIDAIFVDISTETSDSRAQARHLHGHNDYLKGKGFGGRILPKSLSAAQVPADPAYRSLNAENFLKLKEDGVFATAKAYDNNVDGRAPIELGDNLKTNYNLAA
jgi:hypothetical protein